MQSNCITGKEKLVTFGEWHAKIVKSFEKCFWVNTEPTEGEEGPELIARRGVYKDTYYATQFWTNTQLRPNFPVAMVAVSLFCLFCVNLFLSNWFFSWWEEGMVWKFILAARVWNVNVLFLFRLYLWLWSCCLDYICDYDLAV